MSEQTFHTPNPVELEVKIPSGDVVVETIDGTESRVVVEGDPTLVEETVVEFNGNRLLVEFRGKKNLFGLGITISIGDFNIGGAKLRVHAQVPHESVAHMTTASADMHLNGRFRDVEAKSASGDLIVHGTVAGNATLKTVSGDAMIDDVGERLLVTSVSGDLIVQRVGSSVEAKSVSGDLLVHSIRQGEALFTSVSGDIRIGIEPGSSVDVDANSVSGDLSSDVPLSSDPGEAAGDGPVVIVRGKTVSGDFRITRAA
jgi:hypothetical protein